MQKNKLILSGILVIILLGIFCLEMIKKETNLSEEYTEVNLNEREVYKDTIVQTSLGNPKQCLTVSIEDSKVKFLFLEEEIEKEIPNEKITSLSNSSSCGRYFDSAIYALTEQKNVYQMKIEYDENEELIQKSLQNNFEKIYDGSKLLKGDELSFISLNSSATPTTCYQKDTYLKLNGKVYNFLGEPYIKSGPARNYSVGYCGTVRYNFDGTLELNKYDGSNLKVKNTEGKEIKVLLYGKEKNQDYVLDEEGNEYYFDIYSEICEKNGVLNPTDKKEILKIGKKGLEYEILFTNHERKYVTIESGWSVFDIINRFDF